MEIFNTIGDYTCLPSHESFLAFNVYAHNDLSDDQIELFYKYCYNNISYAKSINLSFGSDDFGNAKKPNITYLEYLRNRLATQ